MHVRGTGVSHTVPFLRVAISRGLSIENLNTCAHVCGNAQYDENAMFVEGSCRVFFRYEIVATLLREKGCHDANVKLLMTKLKKKYEFGITVSSVNSLSGTWEGKKIAAKRKEIETRQI